MASAIETEFSSEWNVHIPHPSKRKMERKLTEKTEFRIFGSCLEDCYRQTGIRPATSRRASTSALSPMRLLTPTESELLGFWEKPGGLSGGGGLSGSFAALWMTTSGGEGLSLPTLAEPGWGTLWGWLREIWVGVLRRFGNRRFPSALLRAGSSLRSE